MSDTVYHQSLLHEKPIDNEDDTEIDLALETLARPARRKPFTRLLRDSLSCCTTINLCILIINLTMSLVLISRFRSPPEELSLMYSPLSKVITHEIREFITDEDHLWTGPPNPSTEDNWHNMLQGFDVRVTEDDMQQLGRLDNAVEIKDESGGYVALINVYHELHCLKLIRWSLYPDYFYPNTTEADRVERERHRDHCINYIRQSAMCHADVGVSTWHWRKNDPMPHADMMPHTCRNWVAVDTWAKNHKINMYEPGLLVHPVFGAAFPKGGGANEDDGAA